MSIISESAEARQVRSLPPLAAHTIELLQHEGVRTLGHWRQLGRKRLEIFGITPAIVKKLDAAARERRQ